MKTINIDPALHKLIKVASAEADLSMTAVINQLLTIGLKNLPYKDHK